MLKHYKLNSQNSQMIEKQKKMGFSIQKLI